MRCLGLERGREGERGGEREGEGDRGREGEREGTVSSCRRLVGVLSRGESRALLVRRPLAVESERRGASR